MTPSLRSVGGPAAGGIGAVGGEVCEGVGVPGVQVRSIARLGRPLVGRVGGAATLLARWARSALDRRVSGEGAVFEERREDE